MSIKQYTNFESINSKTENEGKYISEKDFVVISKNEFEEVDFGDCKYDVMEVSIYDINNNILENRDGGRVNYIRSGDIKNYVYSVSRPNAAVGDGGSTKELAIDSVKLLNDLGFYNGILRLNINFVRNRVGSENELKRAWIQEISPSRQEIRILPVTTGNADLDTLLQKELDNLKNLNKDFKYYKVSILDALTSFKGKFLDDINSNLETKYGLDYFNILKKDFGLQKFNDLRDKIYSDFVASVTYYLTNKYYDITQSNFGKKSEVRFEDCEQYDFNKVIDQFDDILYKCVEHNSYFLKRRELGIKSIPKEFKAVDITPNLKNVFDLVPPSQISTTIFQPDRYEIEPQYAHEAQTIQLASETVPAPPPVVPTQVIVPQKTDSYHYYVKNLSSTRSMIIKYVDAAGDEVQKTLAAGKPLKICAKENSVSANYATTTKFEMLNDTRKGTDITNDTSIAARKFGYEAQKEFEIQKIRSCSSIEFGLSLPDIIPMPPVKQNVTPPIRPQNYTPPVKQNTTPPIRSGGGGGGSADIVTNNTDTPGGRDIQVTPNSNTGLPVRTGTSTIGNTATRQQSFG